MLVQDGSSSSYSDPQDPEKGMRTKEAAYPSPSSPEEETSTTGSGSRIGALLRKLTSLGVEVQGIAPVPVEEQTKTQYHNMLFLWLAMTCNLLPIVTGMSGTLSYGMSLRDASLTIIFFSLLCYIPTAYIGTLGPKTGMRQMVQARYSFGLYPVTIVVLLNMMSVVGFTVIAGIIAGQTLSAVSDGKMSVSVGIVLTFLIGLFTSFCGYNVIHTYNRWSWIMVLICFIIAAGCGGSNLTQRIETVPAGAPLVLDFGCLIAGFSIAFAGIMSDYSVYYKPSAPAKRIFWYIYIGQTVPTILLMILGAAIGAAVPAIPTWSTANASFSTGGVIVAMLSPAGTFGKIIAVLLAFSLIGNVSASMYTVTLNWQILIPWFVRLPRVLFSVVTTGVMIPVAITAAENFYDSLENFLGVVSYWPGAFSSIIILEHLYFRRGDAATYDRSIWASASELPTGIAAIAAGALSFALVVPSMDETWYVGPIAKHTGDIGFETSFALAGLLYIPLRTLEMRMQGRL